LGNGVITGVFDFFREIFTGLSSGVLFFGGPADIVRYVVDILLITFILYNLLRLLRETRAWQLLKGVMLIVLLTMVSSLFGLEMVGFLFDKILYIVALAFVVIFQPELRRALETVGLKSFTSISNAFSPEFQDPKHNLGKMIDELVAACVKMAKSYTGALIIFERNSKLSELIKQENAVKLDSSVTETMLQSIFYKGSPLHDGAILIRDGRIAAARCHIPLADNYHVREDLGTRHRAAIGASELGDAIAIVISEERGTISIALDGCLYQMDNGSDLRSNMQYLLGVTSVPGKYARKKKTRDSSSHHDVPDMALSQHAVHETVIPATDIEKSDLPPVICADPEKECEVPAPSLQNLENVTARLSKAKTLRMTKLQRIMLILLSFFISVGLWMYIQVTSNPIVEKTYSIPVHFENKDSLDDQSLDVDWPNQMVTVDVVGRKTVMDSFSESDIYAYIDFADVDTSGVTRMPVLISKTNTVYFRLKNQDPETIMVNIFDTGE
jgi:diadenylate cyclase